MTDMNKINFEALENPKQAQENCAPIAALFVAAGFQVTLFGREMLASKEKLCVYAHRNYVTHTYCYVCYAVDASKKEVLKKSEEYSEFVKPLMDAFERIGRTHRSKVLHLWNHDHSEQEIRSALKRAGLLELD